ncbi:hypothetical protein MG293_006132 [Ovis ammon polii]|uniref:Uncharacterized protein n=1 Tax=Ovis ammon polii TaxID=230172 RepID=A0AAD4UC39_OVIAM|nr:hypothetical protein MG293_006132 [Ovis ammon polii]
MLGMATQNWQINADLNLGPFSTIISQGSYRSQGGCRHGVGGTAELLPLSAFLSPSEPGGAVGARSRAGDRQELPQGGGPLGGAPQHSLHLSALVQLVQEIPEFLFGEGSPESSGGASLDGVAASPQVKTEAASGDCPLQGLLNCLKEIPEARDRHPSPSGASDPRLREDPGAWKRNSGEVVVGPLPALGLQGCTRDSPALPLGSQGTPSSFSSSSSSDGDLDFQSPEGSQGHRPGKEASEFGKYGLCFPTHGAKSCALRKGSNGPSWSWGGLIQLLQGAGPWLCPRKWFAALGRSPFSSPRRQTPIIMGGEGDYGTESLVQAAQQSSMSVRLAST